MSRYKKLTLLHSNDLHGDFTAENVDEKLTGGVSMLSGYVNKVRREKPNTIYAIAGDMFRGSVIDSEYRGISTIEIMNTISPDVVTIGNHETDYGVAHLLFLEKCAKFPIINANLYIKSNYARLFQSHIVLNVDGMKILFIGIITEQVMKSTQSEAVIGSFIDVHDAVREVGRICNAYNATDIDLTVLLTHIGFEEDKQLAAMLDPAWGVDIIVGGHSHTFIDKPAVVNNIVVVQAGTGTDLIGRFDIVIDTDENSIESYTWQTVPVNTDNCPVDPAIEKLLSGYKQQTDKKYGRVITRMRRKLTHPSRTQETELGGLVADALAESLGVDIVMLGSGAIRTPDLGPLVTYKNLVECMPYDNAMYLVHVTGNQLKQMISYMLRDEVWKGAHSTFFQISKRLKVVYDIPNSKMLEFSFDGVPVEDERIFRIALQDYQLNNFRRNFNIALEEVTANKKPVVLCTSARDVLEEYLINHQHTDREIDGRITLIS